jgi:hypothetical protein
MEVDSQMPSSSVGPTKIPDHTYTVAVENNLVVPQYTLGQAPEIFRVGETVQYKTLAGKLRIVFPHASPYPVHEVNDSEPHTLMEPGIFHFHCFVTPNGSTKEIGWDPIKNPNAGGEHDVRP